MTLPANTQTALKERNIDLAVWSTLQNSVFPGAKDESIILAVDYCKARKLDILKKPYRSNERNRRKNRQQAMARCDYAGHLRTAYNSFPHGTNGGAR